jgi:hypothetical protein
MPVADAIDIPLELRANDIVRHIINIDSRFRQNPIGTTSSNFYFRLQEPVKNVLRIRITSIEFPNNYPVFTAARRNISIRIIYGTAPDTAVLTIPEGNYSACDMVTALTDAITAAGLTWLTVDFDPVTGLFTFTGTQKFAVDPMYNSFDRPFDYGLGFNLGFSLQTHISTGSGTAWTVVSDQCAYFAGDQYVFLKVNNFGCVSSKISVVPVSIVNNGPDLNNAPFGRDRVNEQTITALAKIVLRDPKNYMTFDDYASQHAKEVTFTSPTDLTRFHIQVLDAYGNLLDLCSSQFSFSMEVLEVKNSSLYDTIRDSISLQYV